MNLNYLKYFQALAGLEHYGRASEELGIAQSSLSHAIASLEQELGVPLFEKKGAEQYPHPPGQPISFLCGFRTYAFGRRTANNPKSR